MVSIQRILCPIDFSDASRHALAHAVALARWYESQIVALHVVHPEFVLQPPIMFADLPPYVAPSPAERQARQEELHAWLEPARQAGLKADAVVDDGATVAGILARATSIPADLIVMGTHGLGGFERFVLGSVTEKVLRKAACPVMTVPPPAATTAALPYKRLLCPVDFSESSLAALQFAFSLAKEADAHLTILHVFDWPPDEETLVERFDAPEFHELVTQNVRGRLDALVTDDVRLWCSPETRVDYGKPYRRILESAERESDDLIVIGVRGRNPVDLTLFGSTANQVVRRASCPVLTLKQ